MMKCGATVSRCGQTSITNYPSVVDKKKKKQAKVVLQQTESETALAPGSEESIEQLNRIANSDLDMVSASRASTSQTTRKKHIVLPRPLCPAKDRASTRSISPTSSDHSI
ncbi:hypothetical protein GQ600_25744 [Phytophthora cactorum]|nr:hypothetical protein GQ600_25744 [Phytophthora cactorum]